MEDKTLKLRPVIWLRNSLRNWLRGTLLGRIFQQMGKPQKFERLKVVSATRRTEADFWKSSALGGSLKIWRANKLLDIAIQFENTRGLPTVYNEALRAALPGELILFVHDDIWLDDPQWIDKILVAMKRFDVVGVAGCRNRLRNQPAWCWSTFEQGQASWAGIHHSGAMGHGIHAGGEVSYFGPSPAACELLDGAFIVVDAGRARASNVTFDEQFAFHYYDLDFCRSARSAGLSLGTWPISLTHQSTGAFGSEAWQAGRVRYFKKWGS